MAFMSHHGRLRTKADRALADTGPEGEARTGFSRPAHLRLLVGVFVCVLQATDCRRDDPGTTVQTGLRMVTEQERQRFPAWCRPVHSVGFRTRPRLIGVLRLLVGGKP